MTREYVVRFEFPETKRPQIAFSDATKIRLDPDDGKLKLKSQGIDVPTGGEIYPLDTDLTVTTWEVNPASLRQWARFSTEPWTTEQPAGTAVKFKLNDGTNNRYWNGSTWAVAGATNWNTEAEVAANIGSFPATSQKMKVVINLATTDRFATPTLQAINFLAMCDLDYFYSIIGGTMVPALRTTIRPAVDIAFDAPGGTKIRLQEVAGDYNVVSVESVYDHTSDPTHAANLYSSYDSTSGIVILSSSVSRGNTIWIDFTVEPEVYVNWANQDYVEVEKLPAVVVDGVTVAGTEVTGRTDVRDVSSAAGVVQRDPLRLRFTFDVLLLAERNRTLLAMMDKVFDFAGSGKQLAWAAVGGEVTLRMEKEIVRALAGSPNLADRHDARYTLVIDNVYMWTNAAEVLPLITQATMFSIVVPQLEGGVRRIAP